MCVSKKFRCDWVAFYTDCEHEVLPIKEGYRISLTYNLHFSEKVIEKDDFDRFGSNKRIFEGIK